MSHSCTFCNTCGEITYSETAKYCKEHTVRYPKMAVVGGPNGHSLAREIAMKKKYITVTVSGVIISIGKEDPKIEGYSETVIEAFLPYEEELESWTEKQTDDFVAETNKRMQGICDFLNKSKL